MRALLSVADRSGLPELARELVAFGVELHATDGTRDALAAEGIEAGSIGDLTATPALAGGQVKTYHPAVYAGILARRDRPEQLAELAEHGMGTFDIVVVNVRPFAPQVGARVVPIDEAIEMIDVGGLALLSAAARNFAGVAAISDPGHYAQVVEEIRSLGHVSPEFRQRQPLSRRVRGGRAGGPGLGLRPDDGVPDEGRGLGARGGEELLASGTCRMARVASSPAGGAALV